jgi:hypothetical protein
MPSNLRGSQVDDKFKLGRLLDRQIGRLIALEDAGHVLTDLAVWKKSEPLGLAAWVNHTRERLSPPTQ